MDCFIKKIFLSQADEKTHQQFVRFGKGVYGKRALLSLHKAGKVKLNGSFEFANDFAMLASQLDAKFSGIILSKQKLDLENEKLKSGIYYYGVTGIDSNKIREIYSKAYYLLLDAESRQIALRTKKKLPKPGKSSEAKVDGKFCIIEADLSLWQEIKDCFFWDIPECRKAKAEHEYRIEEIIMPENEKDFEKIRLNARRKGKIIRKLEIDSRIEVKEKEFEA